MALTYEAFYKQAEHDGLLQSFSQYDLELAKRYPEFGFTALSGKRDYKNAATDEQRALAHTLVENARRSYGNYTGGEDGSGYYAGGLTPAAYSSAYPGIQDMLDKMSNYKAFDYDAAADPLYASYRKQFLREGDRAASDTLGKSSAMTGGLPSSYAVTAAQQASDYYSSQLTDKLPELYQAAYDRYLGDYSLLSQSLKALQSQDAAEYDRHLDQIKHNSDERAYADALAQQALENQADERAYADEAARQSRESALKLWEAYGYATPEVARILGVPMGASTADKSYDSAYLGYMNDKLTASAKTEEQSAPAQSVRERLSGLPEALSQGVAPNIAKALDSDKVAAQKAAAQKTAANKPKKEKAPAVSANTVTQNDKTAAVWPYATHYTTKQAATNYLQSLKAPSAYLTRLLTAADWKRAKTAGSLSPALAACASYTEYLNAYVKYVRDTMKRR